MSWINVGYDASGNNNNWTPINIDQNTSGVNADVLVDVPTNQGTDTGAGGEVRGNYATLNPLDKREFSTDTIATSNGNLDVLLTAGNGQTVIRATTGVSSGKYYCEVTVGTVNSGIGVADATSSINDVGFGGVNSWTYYSGSGNIWTNGGQTAYGSTYTTNDIIGIAIDMDSGKAWFAKNGTWQNSGSPTSGTNAAVTTLSGRTVTVTHTNGGSSSSGSWNFGQRPFAYTAPSGFKALCTQNLPEPTIADGGDYFNAVLYTGNGGTNTITTDFTPGFVWQKNRSSAADHILLNSVVGGSAYLRSNSTAAESPAPGYMTFGTTTSFSSTDIATNQSGQSYVAWTWAANGTGVSNTDGTITSTVSANTTAGFSIVTYTGTGSNATIGHGLGATPAFFVTKQRSGAENWIVYHKNQNASPASGHLMLQSTSAFISSSTVFNNTVPTSSVFSVGTAGGTNESGQTFVAYVFAPVEGYSAFGSYTGNGSDDGPFVFCGFRPRYLMWKNATTAGNAWIIWDTARNPYNLSKTILAADQNIADYDATSVSPGFPCDILSNGFKLRGSRDTGNNSGATFIYAAFAENPFKLSRAR